ncbi:MAG: hypothetical protein IJF27_00180 [Oscillospiraceae bacterium]|nr:hypothetical protein [Oscillospiraceae bacterium]MBQ3048878.1 hypothetical protein [Oscillospiraceae bacterium]MBQ9939361.1 hypothetical protein [Oscillospiraceae bacterium]
MSRSIYSKKKKNSGFGMIYLISFLFIVLLSFVLATIWQQAEDAALGIESSDANESSSSSESVPESSSEPESSVPESSAIDFSGITLVPELDRVTSEYFDNAVFIGDSLTEGIKTYGLMSNSTIIAATGINISTITTNKVIKSPDGRITVLDALEQYPDTQKVYILLGANGIAWIEKDLFIHLYTEFITAVKQLLPDATIYVQSIFPINEAKFAKAYKSDISNEKIREYNDALLAMCEELNVYYLNVAETIVDGNGSLPESATTDGMHIGTEYYEKWFNYLKKHAVPVE